MLHLSLLCILKNVVIVLHDVQTLAFLHEKKSTHSISEDVVIITTYEFFQMCLLFIYKQGHDQI